ncbi:MAG: hypothetical protein DI532_23030 [Azospirillum brasilense]|nr:MAG: hypothetical protein DI532_23030 [Azospirillum brasilense]
MTLGSEGGTGDGGRWATAAAWGGGGAGGADATGGGGDGRGGKTTSPARTFRAQPTSSASAP